ncbi:MAG: YfhO family protein [Verrucomicrobia bacterium]|nr:YfhO family protein [Verrucomicrobiota bacterium]
MLLSAWGGSTQAPRSADVWFESKRFVLLLALLIVTAFPDVLFAGRTLVHRDFGIFGYPLAYYHRESFWRGEIPLWNPLNNCGLPFLAQWNAMVLYPFSLFYLLLPISWSLGVFCLLHLGLAGLGMYFLAYRWTGSRLAAAAAGIAFAFNGLTLSCLKWPNNIAALAWMPLVVLLVERAWRHGGRAIILAGLAGATQMLSGGPEIILFTWLVVAVFWCAEMGRTLWRRRAQFEASSSRFSADQPAMSIGRDPEADGFKSEIRNPKSEIRSRLLTSAAASSRLAGVIALVSALSSAQLLPFLDLLTHSQRGASYSDASWAMPSWGWANFFVPLFHCFPSHLGVFAQHGQYWISSYYAGIGVLGLAGLALWRRRQPEVWLLATMTILSLAISQGYEGYLYGWVRKIFPPLEIVRFPIKFVVIANFALPLLAAFGMARIQNGGGPGARLENHPSVAAEVTSLTFLPILSTSAIFLALIGAIVCYARFYPLPTDDWSATWRSGVSRGILLLLIVAAATAAGRIQPVFARSALSLGMLLLLWFDVMTHAPRLTPTLERWVFEPELAKNELKLRPEPRPGYARAMLSPWADYRLNHLALTNATDDFLYSRFSLFANVNLLDELPKVDGFFSLYIREESQIRSLLYAATNSASPGLERFLGVAQITSEDKVIHWRARTNFLAFASAGQAPIFADDAAILRSLADANFDPSRTVYLPSAAQGQISVTNRVETKVKIAHFENHRIDLEAEAEAPALLAVAQTFYHPWKAYVDGNPVRLWRANHAFQALEVPAGRHQVKLVYEDLAFRIGLALSVVTWLGCFATLIRWRPRRILALSQSS